MRRDRRRLRSRLLILGVLPALVVTGFATKTAHLLHHSHEGASALQAENPEAARRAYSSTGLINMLEPWIASYNEGIAAYFLSPAADGASAVELFEVALELAPPEERCRVRHNLALAIEAEGDAEATADLTDAREQWFAARTTLRACLPDASSSGPRETEALAVMTADEEKAIAEIDRGLAEKLIEQAQPLPRDPDKPIKGQDADFDNLSRREQEELLGLRNEEARQTREEQRKRSGQDTDFSQPIDPESTGQPEQNPDYNW
ncbi:hypothetical protein [Nocardioides sp.]|uniref:hypothetical protein n=1 Tax=Nocardioides sp. TaxID=35761 RepID=UPI002B265253|nr:hypothetical protein [Nocardioides sp.]